MNIYCKCGKQLTLKSLRPTKYWKQTREDYGDDESPHIVHNQQVLTGTFIHTKSYNHYGEYFKKPMLLVAATDYYDQEQVNDNSGDGRGCCGLHRAEMFCQCGTDIGVAFLDCYDDRHIALDCTKVIRKY